MRKFFLSSLVILFIFLIAFAIRLTNDANKNNSIDKDAIAYAVDIIANPDEISILEKSIKTPDKPITWEEIAHGIDFTYRNEELTLDISNTAQNTSLFNVYFVRLDPQKVDFALHGAFLEEDKKAKALPAWGIDKELLVGINASMYLPDKSTSTGHMRSNSSINNAHIAANMGGFFLTNTSNSSPKSTILLEKSDENWIEKLDHYDTAVQNFRILGSNSDDSNTKTLWNYTNNKHAIAAYGQDIHGSIYFIFSQNPTTVYELGQYLLALSTLGLDFKTVLYAEGGREACLYINTDKKKLYVNGLNNSLFNFHSPLPNIIGAKLP